MSADLLHAYRSASTKLLYSVSAFNQEQFNQVPATGGWSAGQVANHLIKASVVKALQGPAIPTSRPADQHLPQLQKIFLNFDTKLKSPEFILPDLTPFNKAAVLQELKEIEGQMEVAIQSLDLSGICQQAPPVLGELSRLELVWFNIFHTQRHTHQLNKLLQELQKQEESLKHLH